VNENRIRRPRATTTMLRERPQFKHDENIGAYVLKESQGGIN
jgi:hypothetical protein